MGATSFSSGAHDTSWLHEYDGGSGLDAPTDIQYLYSVYWALTTLTTVGYGDITPTNDAERTYALASLLVRRSGTSPSPLQPSPAAGLGSSSASCTHFDDSPPD